MSVAAKFFEAIKRLAETPQALSSRTMAFLQSTLMLRGSLMLLKPIFEKILCFLRG